MTSLTLAEKLEFLWNDFIAFVNGGVSAKKYPEEILNNFKLVDKRKIKKMSKDAAFVADCSVCSNNCCTRIDGKILLSLKDLAVLIDNGHQSSISGSYKGFATLLNDYQDNRDVNIFNSDNVTMQDKLSDQYMPYLKKDGSTCVFLDAENKCKIHDIKPSACKSFPHRYDSRNNEILWIDDCGTKGLSLKENDKDRAIRAIIDFENERIKDIALIMLNSENLAKIGYEEYL